MHSGENWSDDEMAVKLVILDCDLTLWNHNNVSELRLPFSRLDADTVQDANGVQVRLLPGGRELLAGLQARGILVSIASWNLREPVFAILDLLGLTAYFTRPKVEPHPYKERTIAGLLEEFAAEGIVFRPDEVLYVDDRALHLRRVRETVGAIRTLRPGRDIKDLREVMLYLDQEC